MLLLAESRKFQIIAVLSFIFTTSCLAQGAREYQPRKLSTYQDKELISEVKKHFDSEIAVNKYNYKKIHLADRRREAIWEYIKDKKIIKDDTLQQYLDRLLNRIVTANHLDPKPRRILILSSEIPNAACVSDGLFVINIGLLGQLTYEDELNFALAHEIAHDELGHVPARTGEMAKTAIDDKTEKLDYLLREGHLSIEQINDFRLLLNSLSRSSRAQELEADSLAAVLQQGTNYNLGAGVQVINILKTRGFPKYPVGFEMFLPLHFAEYPFEDHWLADAAVEMDMNTFLFNIDSLATHPEPEARKERYETVMEIPVMDVKMKKIPAYVSQMAEYETVESGFKNKHFDFALLQALMLLTRHPDDQYLETILARMLYYLYLYKSQNQALTYLLSNKCECAQELKLTWDLLTNLTEAETLAMLHHFLDHNFNPGNQAYYYLLWKVYGFENDRVRKEQINQAYKDAFNEDMPNLLRNDFD